MHVASRNPQTESVHVENGIAPHRQIHPQAIDIHPLVYGDVGSLDTTGRRRGEMVNMVPQGDIIRAHI